jgi:transketolase
MANAIRAPPMDAVERSVRPLFVGMRTFGARAPYNDLYRHFHITGEAVAQAALT